MLGLINASAKAGGDEPATDIQAALLALTDIGAEEQLLRMATAIHDGSPKATGPALAYAFERLSPTLSPADEATVLVAALGHAEPIVRRYAITRLTELGNADALAALEGRLAAEGDELRPLVEVAIAQLRDAGTPAPQNEVERAKANAKVLWAKTTSWWSGLSLANQGMIGASPILLLVVFTLLRRAGRRRAQAADAQAAAAWVQPSDEYLDQQDEGFDEDNYEDDFDPEFDEGEYTEQGDLEGDSFEDDGQPKFDTSGWEDDSDKQAVPDGANPEDDLFR